jgi:hypothetical protein
VFLLFQFNELRVYIRRIPRVPQRFLHFPKERWAFAMGS